MKTLVRSALCTLFTTLFTSACDAHSMYQSAVMLDFTGSDVHVELQLPLERMDAAFGKHIDAQILTRDRDQFAAYVLSHFFAHSTDGHRFTVRLATPLTVERVDDAPYVVAHVALTPPGQRTPEVFDIEDDVLLDRIPSQVALVSIRSIGRTAYSPTIRS